MRRGRGATHLPSSVGTIDEPKTATGLGLDGLHRTSTRWVIFFSTPPGGRMIATVIHIDTHCGTVMRPVHSRLYRETPAVTAELQHLLRLGVPHDPPSTQLPGNIAPHIGAAAGRAPSGAVWAEEGTPRSSRRVTTH
jgi:hypothetical protein